MTNSGGGGSSTKSRTRYAPEDPTLPKPWKPLVDDATGYVYYWNTETNVTQYERPSLPLPPHLAPRSAVYHSRNDGDRDRVEDRCRDDRGCDDGRRDVNRRDDKRDAPTSQQFGSERGGSGHNLKDSRDARTTSSGSHGGLLDAAGATSVEAYRRIMGSCWPPPYVPHRGPRQSHHHLDSGSYRSLARIFSLCLELKDLNATECHRDSSLDGNDKDYQGQPLLKNEKVKNKRGGSFEQKKAKRKIAKKRKRAQKEREQGVKRLKLQPIVKPKVIKFCNFYLQGRCQQGDLCKFSHDATPLTKSQPCKHLATDSCLKGDDCPYDHELFKYPCHNILSKGSCHRGDTCKFSHKVPADDSSLKVLTVRNLASPLTAEKLNLGKEKDARHTTAIVSVPQSMRKQSSENSLQSPKEHMRIPKGIQFLSFGNVQSGKKQKDTLLFGKHAGIKKSDQQNQEMHFECHKQEQSLNKKPLTMVTGTEQDSASNVFGLKSFEKKPSIAAEVPGAKNLENEVSDASKILQEFLFGGIS